MCVPMCLFVRKLSAVDCTGKCSSRRKTCASENIIHQLYLDLGKEEGINKFKLQVGTANRVTLTREYIL